MQIKICGITKAEQGRSIAQLGATALGFICVRQSPRYLLPQQIQAIVEQLPMNVEGRVSVDRIGVFVDASVAEIAAVVAIGRLNGVQLHGGESPEFCRRLRQALPEIKLIKAFRVKDSETLALTRTYEDAVDLLLLDAYHPEAQHPGMYGGTGKTLDWQSLQQFSPALPWLLSGGITPDNVLDALSTVNPIGIDLSSGVEIAPGDKDLQQVERLLAQLRDDNTFPLEDPQILL